METALLQAHQLLGGVTQQGSPGQASRREEPNGRRTPGVDEPAAPPLARHVTIYYMVFAARGRGQVARVRTDAHSLAHNQIPQTGKTLETCIAVPAGSRALQHSAVRKGCSKSLL